MKQRILLCLVIVSVLVLASGCGLFDRSTPTPASLQPIETAVAQTLTAVAPTAVAPTETATATSNAPQPTPVPTDSIIPLAFFESPQANAQFVAGETVNLSVAAVDNSGISRVELYADNQLVQSAAPKAPAPMVRIAFAWSTQTVGEHTLSAIAYDTSGNAGPPALLPLNITADASLPVVQILAPTTPQTLQSGAQLTLRAVADAPQGITQMQLYVDDKPYSYTSVEKARTPFTASFVFISNTPGAHTLTVRALDAQQRVGVSSPLSVTVVDSRAPVVQVTYSAGVIRQGEFVNINILAADANGISAVQLWADNAMYDQYVVPNPQAQTSISLQKRWTSNVLGNHTLFVRVMDTQNHVINSPLTNILVIAPNQPTPIPTRIPTGTPRPTAIPTAQPQPAPSIQIYSPGFGCTVQLPEALHLTIQFSGANGLRQLTTYAQYSGVMARAIDVTDAQGRRSYLLDRDWVPPSAGVVDIFATAIDATGQRAESSHISCNVQSPIPPTSAPNPPTASIVSPAMGCRLPQTTPLNIIATFEGQAGLRSVQIYAQYSGLMAQQIYSENPGGQTSYRIDYDWSAPTADTVTIFAVAQDSQGRRAESNHATCIIETPLLPTPIPTDEPPPTIEIPTFPPPPTDEPPPTYAPPPTDEPPPTFAPIPTDEPTQEPMPGG